MELNGTKIENPELFIQTIIKQLEATDLELRIAKYRLEQIQFLLNAEIKVGPEPETADINNPEQVDVVDAEVIEPSNE
jgi:hypothetical protein